MSSGHEHEKSTDVVMQDAREATLGPELGVLGHGVGVGVTWPLGILLSQVPQDWSQQDLGECEARTCALHVAVGRGVWTDWDNSPES